MLQGSSWFLTKITMQRLTGAQWPGDLRGLIRRFRVLSGPYRFLEIVLFIDFGCAGSLLQASLQFQFTDFSGASLVAERRLLGTRASAVMGPGVPRLQSTGSTMVGHGRSCRMACGIFPDQEWNLCFLRWQSDSPLNQQGSPLQGFLNGCVYSVLKASS